METFPELSRKPALKTKRSTVDPTKRDAMENGFEASALRFTRGRRQWDFTIDLMTPADVALLDDFVENTAAYGSTPFLFNDERDPSNPVQLTVRFATLPTYTDVDGTAIGVRQKCTFTLREM